MTRLLAAAALLPLLSACVVRGDVDLEIDTRERAPWERVEPMALLAAPESAPMSRIVFGSCLRQKEPAPILAAMAEQQPDLAVMLGDNVYGDVRDLGDARMTELVEAYNTLGQHEEFTALRKTVPMLTVWDDHDYGLNDQGGSYPRKEVAEDIYMRAWDIDPNDERRSREGVYTAKTYGPEGQRVQIILLDTRYFRDDLLATDERGAPGKERYLPKDDPGAQMLGAVQEAWLAEVLREPADLRVLVSSIQILAEGHGWEAWRTLPGARERLYGIIEESGATNIVAVSGDRHLGGLYAREDVLPFTLHEMTASSLNAPQSAGRTRRGETAHEPGPYRQGLPVYVENFGEMEIDWQASTVRLSVRGMSGEALRVKQIAF
ncbi:alkaline phosphatase D family protein [Parvularcula maris]|uniref:Alkaline phosphatase family protein n=1 Tax=Parvularcula maris TaxID=2965077 RepID=A0A9X2L6C1_9PROT|nr:alkaline phosphatase D family protein [Parvularcula maris]MCQ8183904.1 alkaline phosphatase family protein [Parvularcula maris]